MPKSSAICIGGWGWGWGGKGSKNRRCGRGQVSGRVRGAARGRLGPGDRDRATRASGGGGSSPPGSHFLAESCCPRLKQLTSIGPSVPKRLAGRARALEVLRTVPGEQVAGGEAPASPLTAARLPRSSALARALRPNALCRFRVPVLHERSPDRSRRRRRMIQGINICPGSKCSWSTEAWEGKLDVEGFQETI
ncbi:uncharacterized protein LOC102470313 isoform X2 [Tupaia chinensis]|uniref:uncharacterized protein LOC102470313 isoform X2 n=1 Tax=Tupaia chinensis TaxID=246437 RepID=UPI00070400F9|nr:uncharacterized protein LOC102470313 isoform X2 [Tupaia chinensis]